MNDEKRALDLLAASASGLLAGAYVRGAANALQYRLRIDTSSNSCWAPLPLGIFREPLPEDVRSAWVFVLRAGCPFPAERHPNSIQRMFALTGPGEMEVWKEGGWVASRLEGLAAEGGLSIPLGAWHRPALSTSAWGVLSFHTATADELIEETGDPESSEPTSVTTYERKHAQARS